jgi:membrane protein implicated in regulation of membrane protease activity
VPQSLSSSNARVLIRYTALQIPGWVACLLGAVAAREWLGVPTEIAVGMVVVWIVKDAALFPFVRAAYEPGSRRPHGDLLDAIGIAHDGLPDREGYIRLGPELWRARRAPGCPPLGPGEAVRVVGVDGLTLDVESASSRSS